MDRNRITAQAVNPASRLLRSARASSAEVITQTMMVRANRMEGSQNSNERMLDTGWSQ